MRKTIIARNVIALIIAFIFGLLFDIFGSHEVCKENYQEYQDKFWTNQPQEATIDIQTAILDKVPNCPIDQFIEFKPNKEEDLDAADIKPVCNQQHSRWTCSYPRSMFEHFAFFQKILNYKVYITKGVRTITDGTRTEDVTIYMFKIMNPTTTKTGFYDIVDDPTYDAMDVPTCK